MTKEDIIEIIRTAQWSLLLFLIWSSILIFGVWALSHTSKVEYEIEHSVNLAGERIDVIEKELMKKLINHRHERQLHNKPVFPEEVLDD